MNTSPLNPNVSIGALGPRIPILKLCMAFTLLLGLFAWTPYDTLAQGNDNGHGVANRVSVLEQRVGDHDSQLAELHSNVAAIGAQASTFKLIGTTTQNNELEIAPTPLSDGGSQYLSDALAKVSVPASATRTHLFIVAGGQFEWHQAISSRNYRCGNAVIISIKSAALTAAGLPSDAVSGVIVSDLQADEATSTVGVTRFKDTLAPIGWDINLLAAFLNGTLGPRALIDGQPVTDAQALQIATTVMHSPMEVQVKIRARTSSVDYFAVGQGTVQVWADGN